MIATRRATVVIAVLLTAGNGLWAAEPAAPPSGAPQNTEVELLTHQTPWRVLTVTAATLNPDKDGKFQPQTLEQAKFYPLPPPAWMAPDYDDSIWGRYAGDDIVEWLGHTGHGITWRRMYRQGEEEQALIYLRTRFGIADPAKATDIRLTMEYTGGLVVYLNGQEIARGYLPEGKHEPTMFATPYGIESYTTEDGVTPLPNPRGGPPLDDADRERQKTRIRTLSLVLPPAKLVKGGNVLAIANHRAPHNGPTGFKNQTWMHCGVSVPKLTSISGAGAVAYAAALKGAQLWSALSIEQVTERPAKKVSNMSTAWPRASVQIGLTRGSPFEPVRPIRILAPRNGIGNGQTILADAEGLRDVGAKLGRLVGPGGAVIPAEAVSVFYAVQPSYSHWCDDLAEDPPKDAKTIPIWIEVRVPRDQAPGWYTATLDVQANGTKLQTPVQVFVSGFTAPDPKDFRSVLSVDLQPENLAKAYGVEPLSDRHFELMADSMRMQGLLGNDVAIVPVIVNGPQKKWPGTTVGLIPFVKTDAGLKPEFRYLERYLDLYLKHAGRPKAITFVVWSMGSDKEIGHAYEGTRVPTREFQITVPLQVPLLDPQTGKMAPTLAPSSLDDDAEKFYKPLLDGIREVVVKRGLSERVINLGVGGDKRPSENTANKFRAWAPYARWYLYSHFSGDPGPTPEGKMIATGGMEIGVKACPDSSMSGMDWVFPNGIALNRNEDGLLRKVAGPLPEYLVPMVNRGTGPDMLAGPMAFRTSPLIYGRWSQLGIDSWPDTNPSARLILIWGATVNWLAARGPKGLLPTVRYQMIREGLQDFEASMDTMEKVLAMPAEQQAANRAALDLRRDLMNRVFNIGSSSLHAPATESSTDWESLFARHHEAAATLAGVKIEAKWQDPPR